MEKKGFALFKTFNQEAFLGSWAKFYREVHEVMDYGPIALPPVEQAMGAGMVMTRSITIEQDLAKIKKMTKGNLLYRYTNQAIGDLIQRDKEALRPAGSYALWTAPAVEAIQQAPHLAGKSYNDIVKMNLLPQVMTFGEYARFACWHLWATGEPLDLVSWTLTGSLDADDKVLGGYWNDGRFSIYWYDRDSAFDSIRFRQVVLPPLS